MEITEESFIQELEKNLSAVIKFYMAQEAETLGKLEQLDLEIHSLDSLGVHSMGSEASAGSLFNMKTALSKDGDDGSLDAEDPVSEAFYPGDILCT